jgi:hypothetical protein
VSTFALGFTADGRNLVIGGASGAIEIVDVQRASVARRFRAEKHAVGILALSPDGRAIGAAYFDVDGMSRPAPLALWEISSGRLVRRVTVPGAPAMAAGFSARWPAALRHCQGSGADRVGVTGSWRGFGRQTEPSRIARRSLTPSDVQA